MIRRRCSPWSGSYSLHPRVALGREDVLESGDDLVDVVAEESGQLQKAEGLEVRDLLLAESRPSSPVTVSMVQRTVTADPARRSHGTASSSTEHRARMES